MPSFSFLSEEDLRFLLGQVKRFSPRWTREKVPAPVILPARSEGNPQRGASVYRTWGCASCHGDSGRGDGRLARGLRHSRGFADVPTDFTRPWTLKAGSDEVSLLRSTLTGFNGTTMPAYSLPAGGEKQIWDLVAYLRSRQKKRPEVSPAKLNTSTVAGYWKTPIPAQTGDLSAASCASCHPAQFGDWSRSRHAAAMGPGVWAQIHDRPQLTAGCIRCHAPLAEQPTNPYLAADGMSCSVCHSRAHEKFGPPPTAKTLLAPVSQYPSPHGRVGVRDFFEKVEFCANCHQFKQGTAERVHGTFLQNTVEEWRASRAAKEGKTCQTCHMPDRRHFFRGIHDPETVRGGVRWTFDARTEGNRAVGRMTLTNVGTGHDFPTYVVPEVWMRIELKDERGGIRASSERLIARKLSFALGKWSELSDTRLRPDETATLDYDGPIPPGAVTIVGRVVVLPDAWHQNSLASLLRDASSRESRRSYEAALAEMQRSGYTLFRVERRLRQ
jgi:mono/diheme cytochrome c family protein